jgi:membrane protease YdiL (CAAX protease family)
MMAPRAWQSLAEVVLCSGYPTQIAVTGLVRLAGVAAERPEGGLSLPFVTLVSAIDAVLLIALILWLVARRGESPRQIWLGARAVRGESVLGVLLAPAVLLFISTALVVLRSLWPALNNVADNPLSLLARTPEGAAVLIAVAVAAGGVREELQRGFLLHRFRTDLGGGPLGVAITSAAFGLGHTVQGWDAVIVTASLGAFWGVLSLARGSVIAPMVSHSLANAAQIAVEFARR